MANIAFALFDVANFQARKSIVWLMIYTVTETVTFSSNLMTFYSKSFNKSFHQMMYFPSCALIIRFQLYIIHSIIYFYYYNDTASELKRKQMKLPQVHMWFVYLVLSHYMLCLVTLLILWRLYEDFKQFKAFMAINFCTCTIFTTIHYLVMVSQHGLAAKGTFEATIGIWPLFIVINAMHNMNESHKEYHLSTETNERDRRKFQMCFDHLAESIILVSNGQVEYVNDSFLKQF